MKTFVKYLFFGLVSIALQSSVFGQQESGLMLFPEDASGRFRLDGMDPRQFSIRRVSDPRFSVIWNIKTPFPAAVNPYDFRLVGTPVAAMQKGDVLVATFWMRTISAVYLQGHTRFVVERGRPPYPKSAEWFLASGPEWKQFQIPFTAAETDEASGYSAQFWVSSGPQEIEIAGFQIRNYGPGVRYSSLGLKGYPYLNAEADASWRSAASARIDKLRKGEVTIVLRDAEGRPLANRKVRARMLRHAFGFGSAVDAQTLLSNSNDGERYREFVFSNFNRVTLENDLKWTEWERNRSVAVQAIDLLRSRGITKLRGHTLVWPGWEYLPERLRGLQSNPNELRRAVDAHIADITAATKGKLTEWDVLNEPYTNRDLQRVLGNGEMARWFQLAQGGDPDAVRYVNDFNIVEAGGNDIPHIAGLKEILNTIQQGNGPWNGIGIQGHFDENLTDPEKVLSILDDLSSYRKPIQITEFDVNVADEALQAAYTRDFMTAAFSHPSVEGITIWGFWEGRIFNRTNAMVRQDWTTKANHGVWRQLVYKDWWTDVELRTNADGIARVRGFAGDYEVIVEDGGRQTVLPYRMEAGKVGYLFQGKRDQVSIPAAGIVNAASFQPGPVAPGQAVTIFGGGHGYEEIQIAARGENNALPVLVGETRVFFDDVAAPMIYSARQQVSALVPEGVSGLTKVKVEFLGQVSNEVTLPVAAARPGIFTSASGIGQAVVLNNDAAGSFNSADSPASRGSVVSFFLTGEGKTTPEIGAGLFPEAPFPRPTQAAQVFFGGVQGVVEFIGRIFPGVVQVNARIPGNAETGNQVSLVARIGGFNSQAGVTIAIR
jgi:uncharacterized protein (TIGR03437 family)